MFKEPQESKTYGNPHPCGIKKILRNGSQIHFWDQVVLEEPLEIRVGGASQNTKLNEFSLSITMRTPGDDFALVVGFLKAEGLIRSYQDILSMKFCGPHPIREPTNIVRVKLRSALQQKSLRRFFVSSSACGLCGKSSLEMLQKDGLEALNPIPGFKMGAGLLWDLRDKLNCLQGMFRCTGGVHAAAIYSETGKPLFWSEDIGRHNALDKVIGQALMVDKPLNKHILMLSGRSSYELLQKAVVVKIPLVISVGAPSSAALQIAKAYGVCLLGFLGEDSVNVYNDEFGYCSHIE
ncbi:MAG: formate dehydrogenase accessory sulfurtransferase FdhD [Oligoflexales bacterium]